MNEGTKLERVRISCGLENLSEAYKKFMPLVIKAGLDCLISYQIVEVIRLMDSVEKENKNDL